MNSVMLRVFLEVFEAIVRKSGIIDRNVFLGGRDFCKCAEDVLFEQYAPFCSQGKKVVQR